MMKILFSILLVLFAWSVQAQAAPDAQVLGPMWQGQMVQATGVVIAENGTCRQIAVDRGELRGVGGRLWGCWSSPRRAPNLGEAVQIKGRVTTTRLTKMGHFWRVIPQVNGL